MSTWIRSNVLGLIAIFIALGGTAYAAGLARDSVKAKQIKSGAVRGDEVKNDAITGDDVDESSLEEVPSADTAGSAPPSGQAGGELAGSYPNPQVGTITSGLTLAGADSPGGGITFESAGGPLTLTRSGGGLRTEGAFISTFGFAVEDTLVPGSTAQLSPEGDVILSGQVRLSENPTPGSVGSDSGTVYMRDAAGATQLVAKFPGEDVVVIATDPTP